ncbi:MAG: hypothetical protein HPY59_04165 [Anaerolineae bacterium]|nr:hypothetical protein [Anaerolineae bacterium]
MPLKNSPPRWMICHTLAPLAILAAILLSACNLPVTVSLVWPTPLAAAPTAIVPQDTPTPFQPLPPTLQAAAELGATPVQDSTPTAEPQPSPTNLLPATASVAPGAPASSSPNPTSLVGATLPSATLIIPPSATIPKPTSASPAQVQPKISSPTPTHANTQILPPSPTSTSIPPTIPPTPTATLTNVPIPPTSPPAACAATGNTAYEQTLLTLINQERANQGLSALNWQSQLATAARLHSTDMACNNFFSHTGSSGSTFDQRIRAQGYSFSYAAENLAAGGGPQDAFNSWMNSPGHRANMLSPNLQEIGIGYMYNGGTTYGGYFTANFGAP